MSRAGRRVRAIVRQRDGGKRAQGRYKRLTSPSHLFLPFRQFVQARAPLFGMCTGEDEGGGAGELGSWAGGMPCGLLG